MSDITATREQFRSVEISDIWSVRSFDNLANRFTRAMRHFASVLMQEDWYLNPFKQLVSRQEIMLLSKTLTQLIYTEAI